jgi:UPF0176 protein
MCLRRAFRPHPLSVLRFMSLICNIAAYKFVSLTDLPGRRERLFALAEKAQIKGTILLAPEGINLFLAGPEYGIDRCIEALRADAAFIDLEVKRSYSESVPFKRLRIKIKREIIRMDHPAVQPESGRAPAISPTMLSRWIEQGTDDDGRPLVLLDTRNTFEVAAGTLRGATQWQLSKFTEFPAAVQAHGHELQGKTVVSFCTGGIRCEKAAIYMAEAGISNVYQLDGGILKYFEETDGSHFDGTCFVFDERQTLDSDLAPAPAPV